MEIDPETAARFTLERQHLLERAPPDHAIAVVDDIMGLNAQGVLNFQLSLWNRVFELSRDARAPGATGGFPVREKYRQRSVKPSLSWFVDI